MINEIDRKEVFSITGRYYTAHGPLKVIDSSFTPYVLKFPNGRSDNDSITKEFLCHFLLKTWNIPTPEIIILTIPPNILEECTLLEEREKIIIKDYNCFGSKMLLNSIDLMEFITAKDNVSLRRIKNPYDLIKIALFDIWVENEDRRPSNNNLLLNPIGKSFEITAIDHSFTFSTLSFNELVHTGVNFSYNDSILHSTLAKSIIHKQEWSKDLCLKYREMFYLCIQNAETLFLNNDINFADNYLFTNENRTFLYNFLFNKERNEGVLEEFFYIINTIK